MQKFTLHSHTNSYQIFDGVNSIAEMIRAAESKGFTEYGISNHLICWPDYLSYPMPMYFRSFDAGLDVYKRLVDDIREAAAKAAIRVYVGFEVDFFASAAWRREFEKALEQLDVDYLIGSNHNLLDNDFRKACTLYDIRDGRLKLSPEEQAEWRNNYWRSSIEMVKSGYFDFIAHFDLIKEAGIPEDNKSEDLKWRMVETLFQYKQQFELNTSIYYRMGEPSPSEELLKELGRNKVPVLLSCDSHTADTVGRHFEKAEALLASTGCLTRFTPASFRI
jgi:histidinol-phosphatase (PHP family)